MAEPAFRVLIVDDDDGVREFVARALGRAGYAVVTACDGLDALRIVEAQPRFDLFVLDVMMPGLRGDVLAKRLYDRDPQTKVLYITGYADQFFALRPALRENEAVLVKPVGVATLLDAVSRRLRQTA
jgi:two-component system cell cycle sensor histidine kinase/response regulator CckA